MSTPNTKLAGDIFFGLAGLATLIYVTYIVFQVGYHSYMSQTQMNVFLGLIFINAIGAFRK
jgi:hypothetical protein